ncbi:hypothetical protein U1707_13260 [Sphingomonas sp. PB2P12]
MATTIATKVVMANPEHLIDSGVSTRGHLVVAEEIDRRWLIA